MALVLLRAKSRASDPSTSRSAAASVKGMTDKRKFVLDLFKAKRSMTDEELVREYNAVASKKGWDQQSESGLRSRRAELVALGMLAPGKMRDGNPLVTIGANGRKRTVWTVAS